MDKAARIRWAMLLSLLAATVAAALYPTEEDASPNPVRAESHGAGSNASKPSGVGVAPELAPVAANASWPLMEDDPFVSRGWQAPPAAAPIAAAAPAPAPTSSPLAPAGPPPLPFQFVGSLKDETGQTIYLGRGEQAVVARKGEVLDGTYKVTAVSAEQVEFEYLPTGQTQTLAIPARSN